jgi:hypothetical protein
MEFMLFGGVILALAAFIFGLWKLLFVGGRRKSGAKLMGGSFVTAIILLIAFGFVASDMGARKDAERLGFENVEAMRQATPEAMAAAEHEAEVQEAAEQEARRVAQAAAQGEQEAEREAEEQACKGDLRCWAEQHHINATIRCRRPVEQSAQYQMEWTDGFLGQKFTRFLWANSERGVVTYIGDSARFQNGFGAWMNVIYECDYDPSTDRALAVRVEHGRLP